MTDYKDTLNLPKTELAMKANLPSKEPKMLKHWEDIDLMDWIVTGVKSPDIFSGMITLILDKHLESI